MNVVFGCPVAHREWVLPAWFDHIHKACVHAGVSPGFVFVCDPNDESWGCIETFAPGAAIVECSTTRRDVREWGPPRYLQMVELRNRLLGAVRDLAPDLFFSVDSDILLHPDQLTNLIETSGSFDAVGGRCYMTATGTRFPSWGSLTKTGALRRDDRDGVFAVDVIMAAKLMSPAAYRVDYRFDLQGEDIGWSKACREHHVRLGWDGRVAAKHVLAPHLLGRVDARVGF